MSEEIGMTLELPTSSLEIANSQNVGGRSERGGIPLGYSEATSSVIIHDILLYHFKRKVCNCIKCRSCEL